MKKRGSLMSLSALVAISLANIALPAFASTDQTAVIATQATAQGASVQGWDGWGPRWASSHDVNQSFCGRTFSGETTIIKGRDQLNSGNSGINDGFNQNNNGNGGNQFIHVRETDGPLRINQFMCGTSYSDNYTVNVGVNQANSGNSGFNRGFNQDNSVNSGNQIIN